MLSRPNERLLTRGALLVCWHCRQTRDDCPVAAPVKPMHAMSHEPAEVSLPSPIERSGQRRISLRGDKAMGVPSGRKPSWVKGPGKRRCVLERREKGGCFVYETSRQTISQRFARKWMGGRHGVID